MFGTSGPSIDQTKLEFLGIESSLFLENSDEWIIAAIWVGTWYLVVRIIERRKQWNSGATWSMIIRFGLISSLDITLYASIQIANPSFVTPVEVISFMFAIIFIIVELFLQFYILQWLFKNISKFRDPDHDLTTFETIIFEMKSEKSIKHYLYYPIFHAVRILAAIQYVFWYDVGEAGYAIMLILQYLVVVYVALLRPFESKMRQLIYLCEEFSLLLFLFFGGLFLYDDWSYDNRKQLSQLGYLLFIWSILLPIFGFFLSLRSTGASSVSEVQIDTQTYENTTTMIEAPEPARIRSESEASESEAPIPVRFKRNSIRAKNTQYDFVEELQNAETEETSQRVVQQKLIFPKPCDKAESVMSFQQEDDSVSHIEITELESPDYEPMNQDRFDEQLGELDHRKYAGFDEPEYDFWKDRIKK